MYDRKIHIDLFSGIGGFALAADRVWDCEHIFCDNEPFAQAVLRKHWPNAPIISDIRTLADTGGVGLLHGKPQKQPAESKLEAQREPAASFHSPFLLTGGFPCQPFSQAGRRRGEEDDRTDGVALHSGDGCDIIGVCNGDTTISVQDAGNARGESKEAVTANPVRQNTKPSGGKRIESEDKKATGSGRGKGGTRYSRDMEGNVPVAKRATLHSSQSTTSTEEETRRDDSTTARLGNSSSRTDTPRPTNSSATTATTPKATSEPALINGQRVFLLTGGFPCQPFSQAGKRKGVEDDRFLWPEMLRVIREFSPLWVIAENVRGLLTQGGGVVFERVCTDLEAAGYEVQPIIIPAVAVGAPHRRDRVWFVAHRKSLNEERSEQQGNQRRQSEKEIGNSNRNVGDTANSTKQKKREVRERQSTDGGGNTWETHWLEVAARLCRMDDGISTALDRDRLMEYIGKYEPTRKMEIQEASAKGDKADTMRIVRSYLKATKTALSKFAGMEQSKNPMPKVPRKGGLDKGKMEQRQEEKQEMLHLWKLVSASPLKEAQDLLAEMPIGIREAQRYVALASQRNPRLKALGNAIVPAVAEEIMKAINSSPS